MSSLLAVIFMVLGTPLFVVIGASALYLFYVAEEPASVLAVNVAVISTQQIFVAIPLFTFAGYLLAESKAPDRIIKCAQAFIGWFPGGLAIVALVTCSVFTAFTGASGVTIIALGGLLYPALVQEGYGEKFSLGHITASGGPGVLIFPSIPLILYSIISKASFDDMKIATIMPYLLMIVLISAYCIFIARQKGLKAQPIRMETMKTSVWEAKWELGIPIIVFVGIYGGFITAAESSAIAALYTFLVMVFIHKELSLIHDIPRIVRESMVLVGGIFLIIGVASAFSNYLIDEEIPDQLFNLLQTYIHSKYAFLFALTIFLLIVGMMMDIFSAIIVVVPLIVPVATQYGIDPVHLGVIFLANLELGYCTPPVGLNLFISSFRFKTPVVDIFKASLPFLVFQLTALMLITYVPYISLMFVQ